MFYHRNGRRILDHTRCKAEAEAICASQAGDNLAEQRVVQLSAPVKIGLEESLTIIISVRAAAARSSARRAAWRCPSPSSSSCRTPASPSPAADPGRSGARPQPSLAPPSPCPAEPITGQYWGYVDQSRVSITCPGSASLSSVSLATVSAACLFSFTALATEPPHDNWQNSYKP